MHLKYYTLTAALDCQEHEHPQEVIKKLGITYSHSTPQSIGDQWWFWNCENIPSDLPPFLEELDIDPLKCVGFGLSKEEAKETASWIEATNHPLDDIHDAIKFASEAGKTPTRLHMTVKERRKPYFCPLKKEFYLKFENGEQDCEIRPNNHRGWNRKNIYPGRELTVSNGYGKKNRLTFKIVGVVATNGSWPDCVPEWHRSACEAIYGEQESWLIAFIG